jgi:hypothetical protein
MFLWGALVVAAAEVRKCKQRTTVVFTHHGVIVIPR